MNLKKRISQAADRVRGAFVSEDLIIRLRWFLLFTAILGIYIGFQAGDDWYVKEFATYDWARGLGY
jgi:hypothetical protein